MISRLRSNASSTSLGCITSRAVISRQPSGAIWHLLSILARLARERRSETAVEFALIGSVFFLFIFGIFVISVDQFWQMILDDSVRAGTRQIEVGLITSANPTQLKTYICNEFGIAAPYCYNNLQFSVVGGSTYSAIRSSMATLNSNGTLTGSGVGTFLNVAQTTPPSVPGNTPVVEATPEFVAVQVAYLLPFKILAVPGGTATQNGTPSLYSTATGAMMP